MEMVRGGVPASTGLGLLYEDAMDKLAVDREC